jgi:hypothetical protein
MNLDTINALTTATPTAIELRTRVAFWSKFACGLADGSDAYSLVMANIADMAQSADRLERKVSVSARIVKRPVASTVTAVEFWQAHAAAVQSIRATFGGRWYLQAAETVMATIPAKLRSYKSERGTLIKFRMDHRLPIAKYWPNGLIPGDLQFAVPCARSDGSVADDMMRRNMEARADQIAADRRLNHGKAVEKAIAKYAVELEKNERAQNQFNSLAKDLSRKRLSEACSTAVGLASIFYERDSNDRIVEMINEAEAECETIADDISAETVMEDCAADTAIELADAGFIDHLETELTAVRVPLAAPMVYAKDYSLDMDRLSAALTEVWEFEDSEISRIRISAAMTSLSQYMVKPAAVVKVRPVKPAVSAFNAARAALLADFQDAAD